LVELSGLDLPFYELDVSLIVDLRDIPALNKVFLDICGLPICSLEERCVWCGLITTGFRDEGALSGNGHFRRECRVGVHSGEPERLTTAL